MKAGGVLPTMGVGGVCPTTRMLLLVATVLLLLKYNFTFSRYEKRCIAMRRYEKHCIAMTGYEKFCVVMAGYEKHGHSDGKELEALYTDYRV